MQLHTFRLTRETLRKVEHFLLLWCLIGLEPGRRATPATHLVLLGELGRAFQMLARSYCLSLIPLFEVCWLSSKAYSCCCLA